MIPATPAVLKPRSPAHPRHAPGTVSSGAAHTARLLALGALLIYMASGGGRIVGSDEVTMLEVSRALLHGHVDVPEGATQAGRDGRFYSKNAAGQAVLALPLVVTADAVVHALPLGASRKPLAERALVSFFNAIVTAILLGAFYRTARSLGVSTRAAFAAALLLGFTTPLWVYAKSFMAEPLEALGLLLALGGAARARSGDDRAVRGAALGAALAISAKLSVLPIALACLTPLIGGKRTNWRWPLVGIALALAGHALYDVARFGTPFETGYGVQATPSAFHTPLGVGLYGLLLSSGKGVMWFAPALWLAAAGIVAMRSVGQRPLARGVLLASVVALLLYASFEHWAGDGSFGPRYLVPVLPLAFLAVAFALIGASQARRGIAAALGVIGLLIAIGGVAIYFGAEMREVGDYPYTLPLDNPHFMESSHFNPRFTPILGHWSMLSRNVRLHLSGRAPRITSMGDDAAGASGNDGPGTRLGIGASDQAQMLNGLDFWWTYAAYAGLPFAPLAAVALLLFAGGLLALRAAWRGSSREIG
jgi:hypothetical protein